MTCVIAQCRYTADTLLLFSGSASPKNAEGKIEGHANHLFYVITQCCLTETTETICSCLYIFLSLDPWAHSPLVSSLMLPSPFYHCIPIFFSVPMPLDFFVFFLCHRSTCICTLSLGPHLLTLGEFQIWDWRWYPLNLWSQRRSRGCVWSRSFD